MERLFSVLEVLCFEAAFEFPQYLLCCTMIYTVHKDLKFDKNLSFSNEYMNLWFVLIYLSAINSFKNIKFYLLTSIQHTSLSSWKNISRNPSLSCEPSGQSWDLISTLSTFYTFDSVAFTILCFSILQNLNFKMCFLLSLDMEKKENLDHQLLYIIRNGGICVVMR